MKIEHDDEADRTGDKAPHAKAVVARDATSHIVGDRSIPGGERSPREKY